MVKGMEKEISAHLLRLADTFRKSRGLAESTVGRLAAKDRRFFAMIRQERASVTLRKLDEVVLWFSENWPAGADWPHGIERPERVAPGTAQ